MNTVSIKYTLKFAFKAYFKNFLLFMATSLITSSILTIGIALFFLIPSRISEIIGVSILATFGGTHPSSGFFDIPLKNEFISIVILIASIFIFHNFLLGLMRIALDIYDTGSSKISRLFVKPHYALKASCISLLLILLPILPVILSLMFKVTNIFPVLVLSAISSLYLFFKIFYSFFFMIDKNVGITEAIKRSFFIPKGASKLLLLNFYIFLMVATFTAIYAFNFFKIALLFESIFPSIFIFFFFALFFATLSILGSAFLYRKLMSQQK